MKLSTWALIATMGVADARALPKGTYPRADWELPPLRTVLNANQTLRDAALAHNVYIGTASNDGEIGQPIYNQTLLQQFSLTTAENCCKFSGTEASRNTFTFRECDDTMGNMIVPGKGVARGHNTVWGVDNPGWLTGGHFDPATLQTIMNNHISTVVSRYASNPGVIVFDIVNEAVSDGGNATFKSADPWYPAVPNYVDLAFQFARKAAPNLKLAYNDYGAEDMGEKSNKVYNMIKSMKQRGIPVDVVGLQMHISVDGFPNPADVSANIQRLGQLGVEVHITEMDVKCTNNTPDRLNKQAQIYAAILQACLDNKGVCTSFESWGFTDKYTWLGENTHPLMFDENYNPKPAFYQLLATLQQSK